MTRRDLLRLLGLSPVLAMMPKKAVASASQNKYYQGPISHNFNGVEFFNTGGEDVKKFSQVLKWRLTSKRTPWPEQFESSYRDQPPARVGAGIRVSYLGHASFLLQKQNLNILLDPVFSTRASPVSFAGPKRVNAAGMDFNHLPKIDAVLISHNHYDHMDMPTLRQLVARDNPHLVTPLGNDVILKEALGNDIRVTVGDWGDVVGLSADTQVHFEPTQHWSARGLNDRRHALWASFVITSDAGKVYFIGDTGFGDGSIFKRVGARHSNIDLALIPIGAYEPRWFMKGQHVNPAEAVEAFKLCGAKRAIAHHWGTFQLTDEGIMQPPEDLKVALTAQNLSRDDFLIWRSGQAQVFS